MFAKSITERSLERFKEEWRSAIASIADPSVCPRYQGLRIEPKLGFSPVGRDPESGLFEFAHLQTGGIPGRGPTGKLEITEETGLVFVLIPGGTFMKGSQPPSRENPVGSPNVDPYSRDSERPVHEVTVQPFLLSKYELTQGQWLRFTGENPSLAKAPNVYGDHRHTLLHPVDSVSWHDCDRVLSRMGLRLPTESEWEYAARAGTTTVWWTGNDKKSLIGAVNISDATWWKWWDSPSRDHEEWIEDGYVTHAPVGTFRPNPFGLHDVLGNMLEWCRDGGNWYWADPGDGSASESSGFDRILRGGSWLQGAVACRSAARMSGNDRDKNRGFGVRPAASLQ